ncbi:MAG: ABC transporter permease subunit [Candidatus Korarchaeota archaeon]
MRLRKALLVFKKDWWEVRRNWEVILPMILLPILFAIVLPTVIMLIATSSPQSLEEISAYISQLPEYIRTQLEGMTLNQVGIYLFAVFFFAPFFLILPVMSSSVIASDSFAGEKERKTIEALLATPLSDSELLFGKILVSFIPSMITTLGSFLLYSILIDVVTFPIFNRLLLPTPEWIAMIFGLAPLMSIAAIGLTVSISARVRGFREAQQISVILLLPILGLIFGQIFGVLILGVPAILILIGIMALVDFVLIKIGIAAFQREDILTIHE